MSVMGGVPVPEGPARGSAGRRELPRPLNTVRVLLLVLFGATVLGALGLFGSALAVDALGAEVIGILLYAAAPGILGLLLARHVRTGGKRVWWGLVAVQVWLVLGGVANIGDGSAHGFTQLLLPVLILVFLTRQQSRAWFLLPPGERGEQPKFSLPHMITWRRDRGQTALEYLGLVLIVVALIAAMALSGVGGRITAELQSAICSLSGYSCPASGDGTGRVEAGGGQDGGATGGEAAGGSTAGADGGTTVTGGTGSTGGTNGGANGSSSGGDASGGSAAGGSSGGTSVSGGGAVGGSSGGTSVSGGTGGPDDGRPGSGVDTYPENGEEPEADYDVPASDKDDNGNDQGGGDKAGKEDCGGWGFFGCAWDRTTQVVKGLAVDGVWGDVTGIIDLFKPETWSGIADYGKQLGNQWMQDSKDAGHKWGDGDYLGAVWDWGKASVNTVVKAGDDVFVGDDVRDRWNDGEKTRAVTDVVWNIGSFFIPGYDVAKVVGKVGRLGKLGKVAEKVAEAAKDAGAAARRARKAAELGDLDGVRKAAKEADDAADAAEDAARRTGCVIASGPPLVRYDGRTTGVGGSGTGVLASGPAGRVVLADGGCDEAAKAKAAQARAQERAAHLEQKRLEEPERARKAELEKKKYPEPKRNDTSDPRNYNPPSWGKDLKDHKFGDADLGDGYWAGRDRNPAPNWKNESWLRYQEQITGTNRGQEYVVPHPREGKPAVEYDGWDSSRQTFLEAKNGYRSYLSQTEQGALTKSGKDKFIAEAQAQVEAAGGRAVEWHFSDPDVAKAARRAFRDEQLPVKVVYSKPKPNDSTRKPGAFDE
ncbi:Tox-REase-5 domain-containing protein [Streptomyces sp. NBC_01221]|uniref:Tox-REase-5 domain-containing protein n=1 Tax=unclassified Streptomyces TaxID=2593676 RepID=UPI0022553481|nr:MULTISPECIES: Tox-REase-5 domain-containing protein [unclassified Streptomyces]MCX4789563.1 Tox-REase-5 domain-containing protein [Streptomyces sp. NBC_01221]MCX4794711.1 Tox-REase-5 domain-containing protein [Streptomyces sp. NBC_01242]WSJ36038.1 Tox-REase-5 domain-containing protein [Streptomyces sp. NBC_01321]WSP57687.1 Tox-REase-5 domain-containing protein [Streptomyces sp. NBC_01241]